MTKTNKMPMKKSPRVYCVDAERWDFKTDRIKMGTGLNKNIHLTDRTDIYLTKPGINIEHLDKTCLFTVGGYIHYHDTDGKGIILKDAVYTQHNLQSNHIGIISFEEVGGTVNLHRIKPDDVHSADVLDGLSSRVYATLPNQNFRNKLVGLVLCGELHWLHPHIDEQGHRVPQNEFVKIISHNTLMIDFNKWHLLSKIAKYKNIFTVKPYMGLTPYRDNRIKVEEVKSDDFIRSLFSLSQTFIVVVDTEKPLVITERMVGKAQLPHCYFIGTNKADDAGFAYEPLRLADGRYVPYTIAYDEIYTTLHTEDNVVYPQLLDTLDREQQTYLAEVNVSSRKGDILTGHFITIQTKKET